MRLLSVIQGPVFGGAHNQAALLREPLGERGWETIALVPDEPGNALERLRDAGVETLSLPLHRLRATADPRVHARTAIALWPEVQAIRRLIKTRGIDLVQVHGVTNPHGAIAARLEGAAVVWQLFDTRAPMAVRRVLMPLVLRLADVVMTTGREIARVHPGAVGLGERLTPYIPPVDTRRFRPDGARRAAARAELGVPDDAPLIGTVGNRNPQKGLEYLVRAAAILRSHDREIRVRVLGAPSTSHRAYDAALRREAHERGLADGAALAFVDPGSRVPELLPALDVFALTAVPRSEGIPTVILEAMACGLPVVTTDVGAVRDIIVDGKTGLVVPPRDPGAIAEALGRLLADGSMRGAMGQEARRRTVERYGVESCAETHASAYAAAVSRRGLRGRGRKAPREPQVAPGGRWSGSVRRRL